MQLGLQRAIWNQTTDITMEETRQLSFTAPDSQSRLLAYSTAASLGAFFAAQQAEAAVVQAPGLAPYPHLILPQPLGSTNGTYHYLSIEGRGITNFVLDIGPDLLSHPTNKFPSQVIDPIGFVPDTNNPAVRNGQVLTPVNYGTTNAYCLPFLSGASIGTNAYTGVPWYATRMALSYNYSDYPWVNNVWNNFANAFGGNLGFQFTSGVDGQQHFGYMDVQVNFVTASIGYTDPSGQPATATKKIVQSVVINDCRYETTPNAEITVPKLVKITNISYANGTVTIDFGLNWVENVDPIAFTVETSPTVGPSANWTADTNVVSVTQLTVPSPTRPATYQAQTTLRPGATSQFFRIKM